MKNPQTGIFYSHTTSMQIKDNGIDKRVGNDVVYKTLHKILTNTILD